MGNLELILGEFKENGLSEDERKSIDRNEVPETFYKIARAILSGHFTVTGNNETDIKVFPTCVEMYYHEEAPDGIKDYIVYHRNSKDEIKRHVSKPLFDLGILHNHVSGIDITFERKDYKNQFIRASALIREFRAEGIKDKEGNDECSTHLYDVLFSQFNIFGGFTVRWHDGVNDDKKEISYDVRRNVAKYDDNGNKIKESENCEERKTSDGKYVQCEREWQFRFK